MSRWIEYEPLMAELEREVELADDWKTAHEIANVAKYAPSIEIVRCGECRKVREDGGHANCNGYLYCRKWKTLVDEDGYCSWGEREGE